MLAQGPAIAATLAAARAPLEGLSCALRERPLRQVVIAGCGDSWLVGMAARHAFETLLGVPCHAPEALDYALYDHVTAGPETLVFGLSAGGNTPAVMQALQAAAERGAMCVGLSNTPGSPILTSFDAGLVVHARRQGWPTQSSTAAIALLVATAAALAGARASSPTRGLDALADALERLPALVETVTRAAAGPMTAAADAFAAARGLLFTGAGPAFAVAAIGSAKIRELSPIHAMAIPLEEIHHYRAQKRGDPLLLLVPDRAARERALDTVLVGASVGGRTVALLGADDAEIATLCERVLVLPPVHDLLSPIIFAVPLHLFAHRFAVARAALGLGYPGLWPGEG